MMKSMKIITHFASVKGWPVITLLAKDPERCPVNANWSHTLYWLVRRTLLVERIHWQMSKRSTLQWHKLMNEMNLEMGLLGLTFLLFRFNCSLKLQLTFRGCLRSLIQNIESFLYIWCIKHMNYLNTTPGTIAFF